MILPEDVQQVTGLQVQRLQVLEETRDRGQLYTQSEWTMEGE